VSSIIAYFATIRLGRAFAKHFHKVPYRKLIAAVAVMLVGLVFLLSGPLGLVIMMIATLIGFIPPTVGVKRVHLMGCLILPLLMTWAMPLTGWGWTL
jgi:putative membrane protein